MPFVGCRADPRLSRCEIRYSVPAQNGIRFHESQLWIDSSAESDVLREFAQVLLAKDPDCKSHNARTALKLCSPTSRPARLSGPWSTISTDLSQDARTVLCCLSTRCCIEIPSAGGLCHVPPSAFLHESWDGVHENLWHSSVQIRVTEL